MGVPFGYIIWSMRPSAAHIHIIGALVRCCMASLDDVPYLSSNRPDSVSRVFSLVAFLVAACSISCDHGLC